MTNKHALAALVAVSSAGAACGSSASTSGGLRPFPDRPVAWHEHDDGPVARPPDKSSWGELNVTKILVSSVDREVDRYMTLEGRHASLDVNALDEVPCSTWYCPRNHILPMSAGQVAAGPPDALAPVPPLLIVSGKGEGNQLGLIVEDAGGRRYALKLDSAGSTGLATGAEAVSQRLYWAAGYSVPGAFIIDFKDSDLRLMPGATVVKHGFKSEPLKATDVTTVIAAAGRTDTGLIRAVAVPWIQGRPLGGFDFMGRRDGDPNDLIPHQDRRSLRASRVMLAWLGDSDANSGNTFDVYVDEGGRRFVRHYWFDFGDSFGSAAPWRKGPNHGEENELDFTRTVRAFTRLGAWRRDWQGQEGPWHAQVIRYPSVGWYPAEGWDPDSFHTARKIEAHVRMTPRDAYWGAKLVTSFTNEQIHAAVASGHYPPDAARYLEHALEVRRDAIGRRWLLPATAIEEPTAPYGGNRLCFRDLAIERGYAVAGNVAYQVKVTDKKGASLGSALVPAAGPRTCVPVGDAAAVYRVAEITTRVGNRPSRAARVHLSRRLPDGGLVVVGLERDE